MKKNLKLKALAVAVMAVAGMQSSFAQQSVGDVWLGANTDNAGANEGVFITSNGNTFGGFNGNAGARFNTNGQADVYGGSGVLVFSNANVNITGNNDGTATGTEGLYLKSNGTGAPGSAIDMQSNGNTFVNSATGLYLNSSGNYNGTTNINTGNNTGAVTIGNSLNTTTIQSATNTITGNANSMTATTTNAINAATNNITATSANNIQGPINNIGTNSASANTIGNATATTTVTATAGNASQALANNNATTSVTGGVSQLTARTGVANVATSSQVRLSNGGGANVDANGKLSASGAAAAAPTVGVTLNNGYGNTSGLVVTERQASISGGTATTSATTLTMNDNGATFSRAATGAPVTVTGVADGRNDFDAINVRQFAGAIAAVAAQANVPALAAGQDKTVGLGVASFMGKTGLALGLNMRGEENRTYKFTVSGGLNGGAKLVVGAGAAWSF